MADARMTKTIGNVVRQAREKYEELMQSDYISSKIRIDGIETRGQTKDADSVYSTQDKNSKLMTCQLDMKVVRGSFIEMPKNEDDTEFLDKGIVTSIPTITPVDYYFTVLFFNTTAIRKRKDVLYDLETGDIIADSPDVVENIPCYVERLSSRERQLDAGVDKSSVNKIVTLKSWDIKKEDLLYIGDNCYKVTDIEELEVDMISAQMTYYRE